MGRYNECMFHSNLSFLNKARKTALFLVVLAVLFLFGFQRPVFAVSFSNVRAENFYFPGVQVKWTTDVAGDSVVWYGFSPGSYSSSMSGDCFATSANMDHCVNFPNLTANTTYYYKVQTAGVMSSEYSFCSGSSTSSGYNGLCSSSSAGGGSSGSPPPVPGGGSAGVYGSSAYTLGVEAQSYSVYVYPDPDGNQVKAVFDWGDGSTSDNASGLITPASGGTLVYAFHSWTAAGIYSVKAKAVDSTSLSSSWTAVLTVTVNSPGSDTTAPSVPTGLAASVVSSSEINLSWSASTDAVGVIGYTIFRNGMFVATSTALAFQDTGLNAGINYSYTVAAYDAAGNMSSQSVAVSAVTSGGGIIAVNHPPDVSGTSFGSTYAGIGMTYSYGMSGSDSDGDQIKFRFDWGDGQTTESGFVPSGYGYSASHAWSTAGNYSVRVRAIDSQGAESLWSSSLAVTVGGPAGSPLPPLNLSANISSSGQVNLLWADNSGNENGFKIFRRFSSEPNWTVVATVGANVTSYTDSGVSAGATYGYHINSYNSSGDSPDSNWFDIIVSSSSAGGMMGVTVGTATSTTDTIPPSVAQFGFMTELDGRIRAGALFSEAIDPATLTDSNIYLVVAATGVKVSGTVTRYPTEHGVDYVSAFAAATSMDYQLVVRKNVKDFAGNAMIVDYISPKFRSGASTFVAPSPVVAFAVDSGAVAPKNGSVGIDPLAHIRVKFTKEFDPASTVAQFFTLTSVANPTQPVSGSFLFFADSFEFVPAFPLAQNTAYVYTVFATLKDKSGTLLASAFSASFTTGGSGAAQGGTISGKVVDSAGKPVEHAFVYFVRTDAVISQKVETDTGGGFSVLLPEGEYRIEVFPPSGRSDLIKPDIATASVAAGRAVSLNFRFDAVSKTITGLVLFPSGLPVPDVEVGAYSGESGQQRRGTVDGKGRYVFAVDGGIWEVSIRPQNPTTASWSYPGSPAKLIFSKEPFAETHVADFTVTLSDGKLLVKTVDQNGVVLPSVGIMVDTVSSVSPPPVTRIPPQVQTSDASGNATFLVRGGTYYVRGMLPPESGFLNPEEQAMIVYSGETRTATLVFRKRDTAAIVLLSGLTKREDGTLTDAFVWAWSEKGGFINMRSDEQGAFRMQVPPSERWHIGAGKEISGVPYKASEVTVDVGMSGVAVELLLTKFGDIPLPPAVSVRQPATDPAVAQVRDGAKVSIPPFVAVSSGTIQVLVKPTIEVPSQAAAKIVGTAYDITVRDERGIVVTKLNDYVDIILPYSEENIKKQGVTENALVPSFLNEKTAAWETIDNYTVDKDAHVVIARVKHLTRFAIVAAADVTPPAPPTGIATSAPGRGIIKLSWTNPERDFYSAKIYRSEQPGMLGEIISAETRGSQFTDSAVRNGVVYYYTIRAVDPAGNESGNTNQISIKAVGTSPALAQALPVLDSAQTQKAVLFKNLRQGNSGDDVKTLQTFLFGAGLYPEGLVTGYFGSLTKRAVIRFQEKYASEILTPVGLARGTGFVGPSTRKKMNELLGAR